ncbi:hypothetical protein BD311DRAFT_779705 [Dichomitus squalens]|uniref:N-acetyltransferase domain-containing protein n=1 Tax=Dichomitus squalens TaxID=114155 RepID=A0A4Q9MJE7_9APHY|nr:hypothetical protein BD311DRAFT_779705 [Dichomitus squalens]
MANLRFVRFDDPHAFLAKSKDFDDSFTNFGLGSLYDFLSGASTQFVSDVPLRIYGIYRGTDLLFTLHTNKTSRFWVLSTPCPAHEALTTDHELLASATTLLAHSVLAELADPAALDRVCGPPEAVNAFLETWAALLLAQRKPVKLLDGNFNTHVSYATKASLPPLPAPPSPYVVELATPADLEPAAALYQDFQATAPWKAILTKEQAMAALADPLAARVLWLCRLEPAGPPAAYVALGRVTPRTVAIRNVYVSPAYRRRGVAEAAVRAVTRYYLGAPPYGVRGVPDGPPTCGVKEEVNLNVGDASAEGVYRRSGFLFPSGYGEGAEGGVDPVTSRRAWQRSILVEVKIDTES